MFLWKNSVLQVFGRDTLENAIKITSKTKFSTHVVQIPYHLHPARQGAHPALSNSLKSVKLKYKGLAMIQVGCLKTF